MIVRWESTKPRRGEKFSGGECLGRGIFPRQFGRGGENLKIFPARGGLARILVKFCPAGAGHVSQNEPIPRQNDLIPRQNDPIPRQNEPIPRHGEKKVKIFLAGEGLARKKVKIFLAEAGLARKNLDF